MLTNCIYQLSGLASQAYTKLRLDFDRLINAKDCNKIADGPGYIWQIFSVRYKLKTSVMTKLKDWDNA